MPGNDNSLPLGYFLLWTVKLTVNWVMCLYLDYENQVIKVIVYNRVGMI
nr:MAG TPA: hypothetical protein [Caudoviricetes sp.]